MNLPKSVSDTFGEALGYVVGEATTTRVMVRTREPLKVGEYVVVEPLKDGEKEILGWVEESIARNDYVEDVVELESEELVDALLKRWELSLAHTKYFATVKLLSELDSLVEHKRSTPPRTAPDPGSKVYKASEEVLKKIFAREDDPSFIKLGRLSAHEKVPFYVNVNAIVNRHLAIVAVTGAGKSNTVSVLVERMVKEKHGSVLIFDMHGEYGEILEDEYMNEIEPKLDPTKLDYTSFAKLMGIKDAPKQELYLRNILKMWQVLERSTLVKKEEFYDIMQNMIIELINMGKNKRPMPMIPDSRSKIHTIALLLKERGKLDKKRPVSSILEALKSSSQSDICKRGLCEDLYNTIEIVSNDTNTVLPTLLLKFQDMVSKYKDGLALFKFYTPDIIEQIKPGKLNVLDLHSLDEDTADVVVSITLRKVLDARKRFVNNGRGEGTLNFPIFLVLEEAHILAPANRKTQTKYWVSRITREGRKFGVGLCMVSQRPKGLDQDALSQANNLIVLRLIEPGDQRHVQASSEGLSEELLKQLPSLATGEAIIIGPLAPLPALVKIDEASSKGSGHDVNVIEEWMKSGPRSEPGGEEGLWEE